jgi:hypothetical protein
VLEWELYKNPTSQRVTGVYIKSEGLPLKQDNFPLDLHPDDFKGKKKYSDWLFLVDRVPPPTPPAGAQNLPGATGVPGSGTPGSGSPNPGGSGAGLGGSASPSGK